MSMWHKLNDNCTGEERQEFNEFRGQLVINLHQLRDWIIQRSFPCNDDVDPPKALEKMMNLIGEIPLLR